MRGYLSLLFGGIGVLAMGVFFVAIVSRFQNTPEDKVSRKAIAQAIGAIRNRPLADSITIDMVRLTAFHWDTLYVFQGHKSEKFISQAIGVSWNEGGTDNWYDASPDNLLVFMSNGQIVSHVWYEGSGSEPEPDYIHFQMNIGLGELFTPTTAKFVVFREKRDPHFIQFTSARRQLDYRRGFNPGNVISLD